MNDETAKVIDGIAAKLGTTTEYLWGVLIRQAPISATITLVYFVVLLLIGFGLFRLHKYFMKEDAYDNYNNDPMLLMIILSAAWVILMVICFLNLDNIFIGYFNPEYWAINKILNSL